VANQGIRVVTRGRTPRDLRRAIEGEVEKVGRSEFRGVGSWPVVVSSPELIPYTHHLELRSPVYCPNLSARAILEFDVTIEQLRGMRRGEAEVVGAAAGCDYVATFALGGVSMLSRVSHNAWSIVDPHDPRRCRAAMTEFSGRFHLLPALNWPDNQYGPDYLRNWLAGLAPRSRLLVFDTGHDGGGVRAAANIIREAIRDGLQIGPSTIMVLGIVDRRLPEKQVESDDYCPSPSGRSFRLSVVYKYVPSVVTEDCNALLGYQRSKDQTAILPVRRPALFSLTDRNRVPVRVVGTTSPVNIYDDFMGDVADRFRIRVPSTREASRRVVTKLLDAAGSIEANDIKAAHDWGLLDRKRRDGLICGIDKINNKFLKSLS
jgi:hypothetical protein